MSDMERTKAIMRLFIVASQLLILPSSSPMKPVKSSKPRRYLPEAIHTYLPTFGPALNNHLWTRRYFWTCNNISLFIAIEVYIIIARKLRTVRNIKMSFFAFSVGSKQLKNSSKLFMCDRELSESMTVQIQAELKYISHAITQMSLWVSVITGETEQSLEDYYTRTTQMDRSNEPDELS